MSLFAAAGNPRRRRAAMLLQPVPRLRYCWPMKVPAAE
jgi:hypothetical protein